MKKLFLFAYLLAVACNHSKNMQESAKGFPANFDKQGHRGCRGLMPENSIPAMLRALDLGVTTLEMDAVITRDRQVILSHEPFFNHEITTRQDGSFIPENDERNYNIYTMTYAETQQYDVGLKPHPRFPGQKKLPVHKPLLADLIDSVQQYLLSHHRPAPWYNIETKTQAATDNLFHPAPTEFVETLMNVVQKKSIEDHVIIQSFDFRTLQYLHIHYPAVRTAMLIEGNDKRSVAEQLKELGFTPTIYSPEYTLVNDELINRCHKLGMKIIPWTVDEKDKLAELKKAGVDGIISDYPDLFQ